MATTQQISKVAATIVEFQQEFASLTTADRQWIIQHGKEAVSLFVKTVASREDSKKLVLISDNKGAEIKIKSLDGKMLISKTKNIFHFIEPSFDYLKLNEFGPQTPETLIDVYQNVGDRNSAGMFKELNSDLDKLVMTQSQIIFFCKECSKSLCESDNTVFLTKARGEYFLITVSKGLFGLSILASEYKKNYNYYLERTDNCYIVVPKKSSEIVTIDCDANPFIPEGCKVEEHKKGGQLKFDPVKTSLYLSKKQNKGSICGNDLRKELNGKPVMNANVLDYLLAHPELIPEEWKGKCVFFWGTIYRDSDGGLYVRYLDWDGSEGNWSCGWLDGGFDSDCLAVLS